MHQNKFKISYRNIIVSLCLAIVFITFLSGPVSAENWPGWRGPRGDGTSLEKNVPVRWSSTENIAWKAPIPGKGHASPIVWDSRIFVVTALEEQKQRVLLCLDRSSGNIIWQRVVLESPLERKHSLNSYATSTPVTDGEKVYVSFLDRDKMFVAAYDFEGNKVWEVRPGVFSSMHGYCSSPVLWKDKVIVNGDHDGPAYIVALDRATGKTIWKTPRPNMTRSYCAPVIYHIDGRNQMILSGSKCVASYDPDTGKQHWIIDGPTEQFVASLVYNGELLFMTSGFPDLFMQGIRPDGSGNVTDTHIVWQKDRDCSYVPSPVAAGPYFLVVSDSGVATCLKAKTGESLWRQRLEGKHSPSLLIADGLVYFLSDKGVMTVVRPGPEYEVVARNELGEETRASPAISSGQMFLRGVENLYCIGTDSK
ncbi:MAG: PQQ-binding-like beta-propeller repeat protein [Phycisphaerae bacterium]|nr:PQQ-binding-like beta-propeller repeat protein [Phycisphaerae bacterium]